MTKKAVIEEVEAGTTNSLRLWVTLTFSDGATRRWPIHIDYPSGLVDPQTFDKIVQATIKKEYDKVLPLHLMEQRFEKYLYLKGREFDW